jgi:predicted nuclease of restriction endonuclease-like (RecB) superfamily
MRKTQPQSNIKKKQEIDYEKSFSFIVGKIEDSKHKAITTVNKLLIEVYWFIGETIVNLQEKSEWGEGVVEQLSRDLRMKYPDMSGFSVQNLWYMKRFYSTYKDKSILQPLAGEISRTNNVIILE